MARRRRIVLIALLSLLGLVVICAGVSLYLLQSSWFKNQVR